MRTALQISSGTGPAEVRSFVAKLAAWFEQRSLQRALPVSFVQVVGDPSEPRSVSLVFDGDAAAMFSEFLGTHVLVARSSTRGRKQRKRWFAGVAVHALTPECDRFDVPESELRVTAARAGGPGGQHVNTTSSAVRVLHIPTGISIRVASERSQHQNRRLAARRLAGVLAEQHASRTLRARDARRASHYQFERGRPVCAWRLDPQTGALIADDAGGRVSIP